MSEILLVLVVAFSILLIFALPYLGESVKYARNQPIRDMVFSGDFITADRFESDWIHKGFFGNYGSKYVDGPGCYIILMFNSPVSGTDYSHYVNGYVGQSINVCSRVHNHLNGKGNGDVYADRKAGKYLYVKIIPCSKSELNDLEIRLIAAFDFNRLYNRSKGAGSKHEGIPDSRYRGNFEVATRDTRPHAPSRSAAPINNSSSRPPVAPSPPPRVNPSANSSVPKNPPVSKSIESLKRGAMNGDISAQYKLGCMYEQGITVEKDYYYAAMWYRMAAERHHRKAIVQLAAMYRDGRGVPKDYETAIKMLRPLAANGDQNAIHMLEDIQRSW